MNLNEKIPDFDFDPDFDCTPETLHNAVPGFEDVCRRWALIALGSLGGAQQILRHSNCVNPSLLEALGIPTTDSDGTYDRTNAMSMIREALQQVQKSEIIWPTDSALLKNVRCLTTMLRLGRAEEALLTLVVLERQDTVLSQALDTLGSMNNSRLYDVLCQLLRLPEIEVRAALSPTSRLFRTGLLRIDSRIYSFEHKIDLIAGLSEKMIQSHTTPYAMFSNSFIMSKTANLAVEDYSHVRDNLQYLKSFLSKAIQDRSVGVNILVYGPPGTGKTELTRTLSRELQAIQFEIATETEEGSCLTEADRLNSYQLSQNVLSSKERTILLFDEVEDIFSAVDGREYRRRGSRPNINGRKAWVNKVLEGNLVPTFWVSNDITDIDPAHLRRFSFHLQLGIPPRSVRERIVTQHTQRLSLSKDCIRLIADSEVLSPAMITTASDVAHAIMTTDSTANIEQVLPRLLSNSMRALGENQSRIGRSDIRLPYDPTSLNASHDLSQLVEGIRSTGSARICLYGPPGSGKTAFAHHLAEVLDRALLVRRASDILGSLVGETERNIATVFSQAEEEDAVLLLDEADSFLQERRGAQRQWEVTGVNQMLTCMESFDGVFIASTNLLDQMDMASLRRFDAKILFDYLKPEQVLRFFASLCRQLGLANDPEAEATVASLGVLTPGDFAALLRQSRLVPIDSGRELARRLSAECALKPNGHRAKIGFN